MQRKHKTGWFRRLFQASALCALACGFGLAGSAADPVAGVPAQRLFSVRDFGAKGDGLALDTEALNGAIEACSRAGGGQVVLPPGRYLSGTVRLRSHVHLFLEAGATLVGTTNLALYQPPAVPAYMPEAKWGKWHRALIAGESVEDVTIGGHGVIDGGRVFDPTGEERMRGPHTIVFVGCRQLTIRGLTIVDSANYAVFFQASDEVDFRNVKITGGWDGIHFRGAPGRWCRNVNIIGCQFYTGDDAIAGRYWDNVVISGCVVNSSCNGLRLIGPATRLIVENCLFYGPGNQPHRTSNRTNMLSGIILQPGAWDATEGLLDDVLLANNTMRDVASAVTLWTKPGNPVGKVTISGLNATGVYRSAFSFESWLEMPLTNVVLRNAHVEFVGGGKAEQASQAVKGPGVDARSLPAWGIYARGVERLTVEDVRLSLAQDDFRPVVLADRVGRLDVDSLRFTPVAGVPAPILTTNVGKLTVRNPGREGSP
jgi:polygalacturonase